METEPIPTALLEDDETNAVASLGHYRGRNRPDSRTAGRHRCMHDMTSERYIHAPVRNTVRRDRLTWVLFD